VKPDSEADRVLLEHIEDCLERIEDYTGGDRSAFLGSRLVQDTVIRNLQTLAMQCSSVEQNGSNRLVRYADGPTSRTVTRSWVPCPTIYSQCSLPLTCH
jgi:hypothetical protein